MFEDVIPVKHASEEHGYISRQKCECGGSIHFERFEFLPVKSGLPKFERAECSCVECKKKHEYVFDVSTVFSVENMKDLANVATWSKAWPPPFEGPYGLRGLPRKYRKQVEGLRTRLESREVSKAECDSNLLEIINEHHPKIAGRYQVHGYRKGSMGFVYFCTDTKFEIGGPLTPFVVCKCLGKSQDSEVIVDDVTIKALQREVAIWNELGCHDNIISLRELIHVSPESVILVLESIDPSYEGRLSLRDWIGSAELSRTVKVGIIGDLVRAMVYAESQIPGFVHGDIKPSNVILDVGGGYQAKLTDFGLSRIEATTVPEELKSIGTRAYLAPESWDGQPLTQASDVYAFGLVCAELLAGRHPLSGGTDPQEIRLKHESGITLPKYDSKGLEDLAGVIVRCVSKDPVDRPRFTEISKTLGLRIAHTDVQTAPHELNDKATNLIAMGQFTEAIPLLKRVVNTIPDFEAAWTNLGVAYSKSQQAAEADEAFQRAKQVDPDSSHLYASLASHLTRQGELELALKASRRATKLAPDSIQAWATMASILNSMGKYQRAEKAAQKGRKLDPSNPYVLVELSFAWLKLGKRGTARKFVEKALKISPNFEYAKAVQSLIEKARKN